MHATLDDALVAIEGYAACRRRIHAAERLDYWGRHVPPGRDLVATFTEELERRNQSLSTRCSELDENDHEALLREEGADEALEAVLVLLRTLRVERAA